MVLFFILFILGCSMQITHCMEEKKEMLIEQQLKAMSGQQFEAYLLKQKLPVLKEIFKEKKPHTSCKKQNSQKSPHRLTCHQNEKGEWVVENSEGGYLFERKEPQTVISSDFLDSINKTRKSRPILAHIEDTGTRKIYQVFATKNVIHVFSGCKGVIGVCACLNTNHFFQSHIKPQMGECTCDKKDHIKEEG